MPYKMKLSLLLFYLQEVIFIAAPNILGLATQLPIGQKQLLLIRQNSHL